LFNVVDSQNNMLLAAYLSIRYRSPLWRWWSSYYRWRSPNHRWGSRAPAGSGPI